MKSIKKLITLSMTGLLLAGAASVTAIAPVVAMADDGDGTSMFNGKTKEFNGKTKELKGAKRSNGTTAKKSTTKKTVKKSKKSKKSKKHAKNTVAKLATAKK